MKKRADLLLPNGQYKRIDIWYVDKHYKQQVLNNNYEYDIKQFYKDFYKGKLYSTHFNVKHKKNLSLNIKDKYYKSYFKYYPGQSSHSIEETVPHELFKDIIGNMSQLTLRSNHRDIILFISESDIEHKFKANGNTYYADIFFKFYKSIPEEYFYKWNGELCFEIKHTHAVEAKKHRDCYKEGIAIFEHSISSNYVNMISRIINEQSENAVVSLITNALKEYIYGEFISDPESEEFKMINRLNNEISFLNKEKIENQKTIRDLDDKINILEDEKTKLIFENAELISFKKNVKSKKTLNFLLKLYRIK